MSEQVEQPEEPEYPTHCSECGSEMTSIEVGWQGAGPDDPWPEDHSPGAILFQDVCSNDDCLTHASDLAPAADPETGARLSHAPEGQAPVQLPGSPSGGHGGG